MNEPRAKKHGRRVSAEVRSVYETNGVCMKTLTEDIAAIKAARAALGERIAKLEAENADLRKDAERMRFLAAHCRSTSEHWGGRWSIVIEGPAPKSHDSEDDFYAAIDAAIAKKESE